MQNSQFLSSTLVFRETDLSVQLRSLVVISSGLSLHHFDEYYLLFISVVNKSMFCSRLLILETVSAAISNSKRWTKSIVHAGGSYPPHAASDLCFFFDSYCSRWDEHIEKRFLLLLLFFFPPARK